MHANTHVIDCNVIEMGENTTYEERLVRILEHRIKKLRKKEILLVKIQWKHHDE